MDDEAKYKSYIFDFLTYIYRRLPLLTPLLTEHGILVLTNHATLVSTIIISKTNACFYVTINL